MLLTDLCTYLDDLLDSSQIEDYCPNGLQVARQKQEVKKIALAVTASLEVIQRAAEAGADVLIVHHGYFWKNESPNLVSMKYQRIQALLQRDIALLAYHLPLDVHSQLGNNVQLAKVLGLKMTGVIKPTGSLPLVAVGELEKPYSLVDLGLECAKRLGREPILLSGGDHPIQTIAWCTGAAQDFIEEAKAAGVDAYLSGEVSERTFYQAKELGIHYLACGHHATERYGIQALGEFLREQFGVEVTFFDVANPI